MFSGSDETCGACRYRERGRNALQCTNRFLQNMEMENIDATDEGKNKLISRRNSAYFTEVDLRNRVTLIRVIRF